MRWLPGTRRGVGLGKLGRYEEALESWDQAIQKDPSSRAALAYYSRGIVLAFLGRYEEALTSSTVHWRRSPGVRTSGTRRASRRWSGWNATTGP